ncbi:MAG: type II secretion system GspH family protein [Puniceicoccales bacterium]|jgi:type II secretory pathway pseudopilin PulG|nr:type II secretion system GspH family protein [Puniceicoccales bacterium]
MVKEIRMGFSLLEIVLAIGILGISLPLFLTYMAESASNSTQRVQSILLQNMRRNVQHVLDTHNLALPLNEDRAYCGYKNGCFTLEVTCDGFEDHSFIIIKQGEASSISECVQHIIYNIYPWNKSTQSPQQNGEWDTIAQWVILSSAPNHEKLSHERL